MRLRGLISISCLFLGACQTGDVAISTVSDPRTVANDSTRNGSQRNQLLNSRGDAPEQNLVFGMLQNLGFNPQVSGLGFLSSQSAKPSAFEYFFHDSFSFSEALELLPVGGDVIWIPGDNPAATKLSLMDLVTVPQLKFASQPLSVARLRGRNDLLWVNRAGVPHLGAGPMALSIPLSLERVFSSARPDLVTVTERGGAVLVLKAVQNGSAESWREEEKFAGSEPALSPSGNYLAFTFEEQLTIVDLVAHNKVKLPAQVGPAREPVWRDDTTIAYWNKADGKVTLQVLNISDHAIAPRQSVEIDIPSELSELAASGIVCPVWVGDDLYFSSMVGGSLSISRAQVEDGGLKTALFAAPSHRDEGYFCPRATEPENTL